MDFSEKKVSLENSLCRRTNKDALSSSDFSDDRSQRRSRRQYPYYKSLRQAKQRSSGHRLVGLPDARCWWRSSQGNANGNYKHGVQHAGIRQHLSVAQLLGASTTAELLAAVIAMAPALIAFSQRRFRNRRLFRSSELVLPVQLPCAAARVSQPNDICSVGRHEDGGHRATVFVCVQSFLIEYSEPSSDVCPRP